VKPEDYEPRDYRPKTLEEALDRLRAERIRFRHAKLDKIDSLRVDVENMLFRDPERVDMARHAAHGKWTAIADRAALLHDFTSVDYCLDRAYGELQMAIKPKETENGS
jgi:hypothetical protein